MGYKLLLTKNQEFERLRLFPIFDDKMIITGTQLIIDEDLTVGLENFTDDDYIFANEISKLGYKLYLHEETLQ